MQGGIDLGGSGRRDLKRSATVCSPSPSRCSSLILRYLQAPETTCCGRGHLWPSYLAYVVSFAIIGAVWLEHSAITEYLERADAVLIRLNLLLLMIVAFLPFPTRLLSEYIRERRPETAVPAARRRVRLPGRCPISRRAVPTHQASILPALRGITGELIACPDGLPGRLPGVGHGSVSHWIEGGRHPELADDEAGGHEVELVGEAVLLLFEQLRGRAPA